MLNIAVENGYSIAVRNLSRGDEWSNKIFTNCSQNCSQNLNECSLACAPQIFAGSRHARFLVSIARNFFGLKQEKK